jgi:hypothetical protein
MLKNILMSEARMETPSKLGSVDTFRLSDFEEEMLNASFTKEGLEEFCKANSLASKSLYRYRDKITHRLGFDNFNETIIFWPEMVFWQKEWLGTKIRQDKQ